MTSRGAGSETTDVLVSSPSNGARDLPIVPVSQSIAYRPPGCLAVWLSSNRRTSCLGPQAAPCPGQLRRYRSQVGWRCSRWKPQAQVLTVHSLVDPDLEECSEGAKLSPCRTTEHEIEASHCARIKVRRIRRLSSEQHICKERRGVHHRRQGPFGEGPANQPMEQDDRDSPTSLEPCSESA
jgi:hypothetical protein